MVTRLCDLYEGFQRPKLCNHHKLTILYIKATMVSVYLSVCLGSAWKILETSLDVTSPDVTDSRKCLSVWVVPGKFLELPQM